MSYAIGINIPGAVACCTTGKYGVVCKFNSSIALWQGREATNIGADSQMRVAH